MAGNWEWSYQQGRKARLEAEKTAAISQQPVPVVVPLHSLDATMQVMFSKGWDSPTPVEIHRFINPPQSIGEQLRANKRLRDLLQLGENPCR